MTRSTFILYIDGKSSDIRSILCHHQQDPYPGGLLYELSISDSDILTRALEVFGSGVNQGIGEHAQISFLSYLDSVIGLKRGRADIRFWLNTIDEIAVVADSIIVKGICSPQVRSPGKDLPTESRSSRIS